MIVLHQGNFLIVTGKRVFHRNGTGIDKVVVGTDIETSELVNATPYTIYIRCIIAALQALYLAIAIEQRNLTYTERRVIVLCDTEFYHLGIIGIMLCHARSFESTRVKADI